MIHKVNVLLELDDERTFEGVDQACHATLAYLDAPPGDMTLVLTDNATIQNLNKDFMEIDKPTDVLSFPDGHIDQDSGRIYFGDVIISIPFAESQAKEVNNSLSDELSLLSIHGVLHLFGYVHTDAEDRKNMWLIQDQILDEIGSKITSPR